MPTQTLTQISEFAGFTQKFLRDVSKLISSYSSSGFNVSVTSNIGSTSDFRLDLAVEVAGFTIPKKPLAPYDGNATPFSEGEIERDIYEFLSTEDFRISKKKTFAKLLLAKPTKCDKQFRRYMSDAKLEAAAAKLHITLFYLTLADLKYSDPKKLMTKDQRKKLKKATTFLKIYSA